MSSGSESENISETVSECEDLHSSSCKISFSFNIFPFDGFCNRLMNELFRFCDNPEDVDVVFNRFVSYIFRRRTVLDGVQVLPNELKHLSCQWNLTIEKDLITLRLSF